LRKMILSDKLFRFVWLVKVLQKQKVII
jgi:hypothetical protein